MPEPQSILSAAFGARVRKFRLSAGLTQEQLAERSGLHWTYIGQVERGRRNISLQNIVRIAEGLGVDAGQLMSRLGTAQESNQVKP